MPFIGHLAYAKPSAVGQRVLFWVLMKLPWHRLKEAYSRNTLSQIVHPVVTEPSFLLGTVILTRHPESPFKTLGLTELLS